MQFNKVLSEIKISVLAGHLKKNNPVFDKSDSDIQTAISDLTDDAGRPITDINVANSYIQKLGLDPKDPKVAKVINLAVRAAAQEQQTKADLQKIAQQNAEKRNARRSDLKGQVLSKGFVQ